MKINRIASLEVRHNNRMLGTLSLNPDGRLCVFEYAPEWLANGASISPLELPLKPGAFIAKASPFYGNFGIFEDSLPDGYGRYLLHKSLWKYGIRDSELSALQRLSIVGNAAMGALSYMPVTDVMETPDVDDFDLLQKKALEVLQEKNVEDVDLLLFKSGNSGGARPKAVFSDERGHWLVKFRHTYDSPDIGLLEYRYNEIARDCGIDVPDSRLVNGRYFASRRFDISDTGARIHTATAGALLGISLGMPVLDYSNLLALTGYLTQDKAYVEEMFRRMVFNYLVENKDDHCKNFSFLLNETAPGKWQWTLAPAYDLTLCTDGYNGEHATSVNGSGCPSLQDFIAVGEKAKLHAKDCRRLIEQVCDNCGELMRYRLR